MYGPSHNASLLSYSWSVKKFVLDLAVDVYAVPWYDWADALD